MKLFECIFIARNALRYTSFTLIEALVARKGKHAAPRNDRTLSYAFAPNCVHLKLRIFCYRNLNFRVMSNTSRTVSILSRYYFEERWLRANGHNFEQKHVEVCS